MDNGMTDYTLELFKPTNIIEVLKREIDNGNGDKLFQMDGRPVLNPVLEVDEENGILIVHGKLDDNFDIDMEFSELLK